MLNKSKNFKRIQEKGIILVLFIFNISFNTYATQQDIELPALTKKKLESYSNAQIGEILQQYAEVKKTSTIYSEVKAYGLSKQNYTLLSWLYAMQHSENGKPGYCDTALFYLEKAKSEKTDFITYYYLGMGYNTIAINDTALIYYYKALEKTNKVDDSAKLYMAISNLHLDLNNYDEGKKVLIKLERLISTNSLSKKMNWGYYNNLGYIHLNQGTLDSSLGYYNEALNHTYILKAKLTTLENIGIIYTLKKEYKKAEGYYLQGLTKSKEAGLTNVEMFANLDLCHLYSETKEFKKGIPYAKRAYELGVELNNVLYQYRGSTFLAKYYDGLKDYKNAYLNYELYVGLKDSLDNTETAKKITEIEVTKKFEHERELNLQELENTKSKGRLKNFIILLSAISLGGILLLLLRMRKQKGKIDSKNEELKKMDEMKSRFFTNVSHELRTPLTLVMGPLQDILNKEKLDNPKQVKTLLNLSLVNARRINDRVNEILDLSKIESNKISIEKKPVQADAFLKRVIFAFESVTVVRQIQIQYTSDFAEDLVLSFDKNKMETILNNLLSNAIKHSPNGSKIQVKAEYKNNSLKVQVLDEGEGVKADEAEKIFDRFYQSTQGKEKGGTGIGLAFSRELARVMNGSLVNLPSTKGAKFEVTIATDLASEEAQDILETDVKEEGLTFEALDFTASGEEKPLVLVVEDNPEMRSYISHILEKYYKVLQAVDGTEALQILENNPVDIITSDLMMDGMDGFELMEKLKADERLKKIPLIMLTARADEKDKLSALELGVDDYLLKPFKAEELLARLKNLLANIKGRKEEVEQEEELSSNEHEFIGEVQQLISKNISSTTFGIDLLCDELGVSASTLNRRLQKAKGMSGAAFIKEVRLSKAYTFLINKKMQSVKEVSAACGFTRPNYFAKEFYKRFGKKPGEYFGS